MGLKHEKIRRKTCDGFSIVKILLIPCNLFFYVLRLIERGKCVLLQFTLNASSCFITTSAHRFDPIVTRLVLIHRNFDRKRKFSWYILSKSIFNINQKLKHIIPRLCWKHTTSLHLLLLHEDQMDFSTFVPGPFGSGATTRTETIY